MGFGYNILFEHGWAVFITFEIRIQYIYQNGSTTCNFISNALGKAFDVVLKGLRDDFIDICI